MTPDSQALQLLQACVDEDDDSYLRFLVDGKSIKYITIAPGIFATDDMCFGPSITRLLPPLPTGDWNHGYIARNPRTSLPYFAQAVTRNMRGVTNVWHSTIVDHLQLVTEKKLRSGVYEATCPKFLTTVVLKFARFEWEIDALEKECTTYQSIDGQRIGPRFLGHVSEEGRIIGFLMEKVEGARYPAISDYAMCEKTLTNLHRLGLLHGDLNKHNILIDSAGATLIDFECTRKGEDMEEFEAEISNLVEQLDDTSGKGGNQRHYLQD
jgi:predicted Ser/Thr protein kinase